MADTNRCYMVALLSLLCVAVLVLQSYAGEHVYRLTIGGVILLGCAYRIVDSRGLKIACGVCILLLIVRGLIQ